MMNSSESSKPRFPGSHSPALIGFLASGFIGFLDSAYLTVKHFIGTPVTCGFFTGCDVVTSSVYSEVAGIPIALFGAIYYLFWVLLLVWYLDSRNSLFLRLLPLTLTGFLASLVLVAIQVFILGAICVYCVLSAATSTALFLLSFVIRKRAREIEPPLESQSGV